MKIRTKIALVFTTLSGVVLLLLSSLIYFLTLNHVHDNFFTGLKIRTSMAAEGKFEDAHGDFLKEIRNRHLETLPQEKEYFFSMTDEFPSEISKVLPELPESFVAGLVEGRAVEYFNGFHHFVGVTYESKTGKHAAIASAYDENGAEQMSYLFNVLLLGFSLSCLIVFAIGRIFASQIMKPFAEIVSRVNAITVSDLGERLPDVKGNDEIAEITTTFNNMLDRLETAFDLQSNFISNASHELKTPLTSILGESEVILQSSRSEGEYVTSIKTIQNEARKLDEVTTSLLTLSQISFDGKKQTIEPVLMDELLMSIKISLDKRLPGNRTKILIQSTDEEPERFALMCVRVWMELAITNIIQNAVKYSDNKEVLITLESEGKGFVLQISDYGIGIPIDEVPHIFEPFFRASNTRRYTGYGIGLPLTARIVRLHGGKIKIVSKEGSGTQVSLRFDGMDIKKS